MYHVFSNPLVVNVGSGMSATILSGCDDAKQRCWFEMDNLLFLLIGQNATIMVAVCTKLLLILGMVEIAESREVFIFALFAKDFLITILSILV